MKKKHKWWQHLFIKYKYIECKNYIKEYSRLRYWVVVLTLIVCVIISPFIVIVWWFMSFKDVLTFPMGQNGVEEYNIYEKEKEEVKNNEKD